MEERDRRTAPDAGMLGSDRELFAQVWSRVAPGGSSVVEPVAPAPPAPAVPAAEGREDAAWDRESGQLRELVLDCLADSSAYLALTRRLRRPGGELQELYRRKLQQAKRLSAAYFLRSGVRYWPRGATPADPPESLLPALRERYLAEGRMARRLEELAGASREEGLGELYAQLGQDTREMIRLIRQAVEREM